jgi:hypothetical protein
MKSINIDVKLKKSEKTILKRIEKRITVSEGMVILDVKNLIKSELNLPFEIVSEEFYYGTGKIEDTDLTPNKSGLEYIITIK